MRPPPDATLNAGFKYVSHVPAGDHGRAILAWLSQTYDHTDDAGWRTRLAAGEIELDGRPATEDDRVRRGQRVVWHRPPWLEPAVPLTFDLLYEDDDLLAVAKPSGLPTAPAGGFLHHTLLRLVRARWPDASPMHRLGRGTSGVVLFGLRPAARAEVQRAWRSGGVHKTYRALVDGTPARAAWTIDAPIGDVAHPRLGRIAAVAPDGRPARSHVRLLHPPSTPTRVEVDIDTGRPHQIRAHLAWAGHPLNGDPLYLAGGAPRADALPGDLGYTLHAWRLRLAHPTTGAQLDLEAPLPEPLRDPA
jgi:23S rRNA pseudouridine1911/1915/1917 synthase